MSDNWDNAVEPAQDFEILRDGSVINLHMVHIMEKKKTRSSTSKQGFVHIVIQTK